MTATLIQTRRPLHQRVFDLAADVFTWRSGSALHQLDARTLADIGVSASEFDSIEAEAQGRANLTRRRIAAAWRAA